MREMKTVFFLSVLGLVVLCHSHAQTTSFSKDPLLQSSQGSDVGTGLKTGRYSTKISTPTGEAKSTFQYLPVKSKPKGLSIRRKPAQDESAGAATATPTAVTSAEPQPVSANTEQPVVSTAAPETHKPEASSVKAEPAPESSPQEHLMMVVSGRGAEAYAEYAQDIDENDPRLNRFALETSTGFLYNSSRANYSYRNYDSFSHILSVQGSLWLTPLVGMELGYMTTLNGDVAGYNGARVTAKQDVTRLGFVGRHYFGNKRTSSRVQGGLVYVENRMTVPSDEKLRANLKSSGIGLAMKWSVPSTATFVWNFGAELFPRLSHSEEATGINLLSGSGADTSRIGLSFGTEWI